MPNVSIYLDPGDRIVRQDMPSKAFPSSNVHVGHVLIAISRYDIAIARQLAQEILAGADFVERFVATIEPDERAAAAKAKQDAAQALDGGQ